MWEGDKYFTPKMLDPNGKIIEGKFLYDGENIVKWDFGRNI